MSRHIAQWLVFLRWPLLALAVVLAGAAFFPARDLDFDRSIENMFAPDDPLLPPYNRLKQTFGGNEIIMAVYVDQHLFDADGQGIARLVSISRRLKAVPGVNDCLSIDQPIGEKLIVMEHSLALRMQKLFEGYTHGADGKTVAVVCMLKPEAQASEPRSKTIKQLRRIMQDLPEGLKPGMLAGEPVMVVDGFETIQKDGQLLGIWSTLLLGLVIVICFRSLRWVLIPLAVVQLALLLTKALLVISALQLSMVSSMLTAIVTVVGIATVVHVIVRFRDARSSGKDPKAALNQTITLLAVPVFWACTTDAVAFLSLTWAEVGPVQDFGKMMAIGSLLVLAGVVMVVPGLTLLGRFDTDPRRVWGERFLDRRLHSLIGWVDKRPLLLAGVIALSAVSMASGVFRVEVETDFTKNFRAGSPIVRSYEFVETNLGGAGVLDVILPAPQQLDWQYLSLTQKLQQRLRTEVVIKNSQAMTEPGLTKALSLSDAVIAGSVIDLKKVSSIFRRPMVRKVLKNMKERMPVFTAALHAENPQQRGTYSFRIMLRARERQKAEDKKLIIQQVRQIVDDELAGNERWKPYLNVPPQNQTGDAENLAQVTGFYVLLTNLIESMVRDQWITFAVATTFIGLMMFAAMLLEDARLPLALVHFQVPLLAAIVGRSVVHTIVLLVPNAMPILMVLGAMGHLGMKINMGAAMIAAVSMGLSIDSSIHYMIAYRRGRAAGQSVQQALIQVQQSVGRAAVFSTLALIVGFSVLCASQFVPTIYFGVLVSVSMAGGLLGNLLVLPLLLKLVSRDAREDNERNVEHQTQNNEH